MSTVLSNNTVVRLKDHLERVLELVATVAGQASPTVNFSDFEGSLLDHIVSRFELLSFERDVLVLALGCDLEPAFGLLVESISGSRSPSLGVALTVLREGHWAAVAPDGALRKWRLIELSPGNPPLRAAIRLNEFVFHALLGARTVDARLSSFVTPLSVPVMRFESQSSSAGQLRDLWSQARSLVQVLGPDRSECMQVISATADGSKVWRLTASGIPSGPDDLAELALLLNRDAAFFGSILAIEADLPDQDELKKLDALLDRLQLHVCLVGREPIKVNRPSIRIEVDRPTGEEQAEALGGDSEVVNRVCSTFRLGSREIRQVIESGVGRDELWAECRRQGRVSMDGLAQRIEGSATWNDLVVPSKVRTALTEISNQVWHRKTVYRDWQFEERSSRGLGVAALFAGSSGTGKTLAAEVLGTELNLDVYRIDLSALISKYIGETEKNLRRIFDAADGSGAILLFDEADALFGKRSEVKDSHDRYANIEVSYLLQRMEAYRGVAILTTNMKESLDPAFLRRLRFVVNFPFPDAELRERIWRKVFPAHAPIGRLDYLKLARLSVTGASIRNIAIAAAFLAAEDDTPISMLTLLKAARSEVAKLERPLSDSEVSGWN